MTPTLDSATLTAVAESMTPNIQLLKFISTGLTHSGDGNRRPRKPTQASGKTQHKALQKNTKKFGKIGMSSQNRPTKTVKNPKTLVNEISQKQTTCQQEVGIDVCCFEDNR